MKIKTFTKKRTLITLFFLVQISVVFSQTCLPSGITFSNQQQIDDFAINYPGCTEVTGAICVGDCTFPFSNSNISNLIGLSQLTKLDEIYIRHNDNLADLSGLHNVTTIVDYLWVGDNNNLGDITALSTLSSVGRIRIGTYNSALTSLTGLEGITSLNPVGGHLTIDNNYALPNLNGLQNITSIGSNLEVVGNSSLTTLEDLQNLTSMGGFNLFIHNSDMLTSLSGLENIDFETIPNLLILDSDNLSDCALENLCNFLMAGGTSNIGNNDVGCNNATEIVNACAAILPVEMLDFSGKASSKNIQLEWSTRAELNNKGFEIQKSHIGRDWEAINFVEGNRTTNELNEYQYVDEIPYEGINYYRLKQYDFDGAFDYSNVVAVQYHGLGKMIQVYPNPSKGAINFQINTPSKYKMKITITNNLGRKIWESGLVEGNANWRKEINIKTNGIYFISAQLNDEIYFDRLIISDEN